MKGCSLASFCVDSAASSPVPGHEVAAEGGLRAPRLAAEALDGGAGGLCLDEGVLSLSVLFNLLSIRLFYMQTRMKKEL